ncbi:hypothetical protein Cgig2_023754 [Carnegiea gigantea]|uniref:Uncharacterized protein n=1 Tax=Carnegiea gigantea TaxID=171969 RepID=A0A9Q1QHE2_9CARY|nr:hypothetical protein Cgig2_023754 [Carnegiea gigantea]
MKSSNYITLHYKPKAQPNFLCHSHSFLTSSKKNPNSNARRTPRLKQTSLLNSSDFGTTFAGSSVRCSLLSDKTTSDQPQARESLQGQHIVAENINTSHGLSEDVISSLEDEVASNENENENDHDHEFIRDDPENEGEYNQSAEDEDEEGNEEQDS